MNQLKANIINRFISVTCFYKLRRLSNRKGTFMENSIFVGVCRQTIKTAFNSYVKLYKYILTDEITTFHTIF